MIIYKNTAAGFREDVDTNRLKDNVVENYLRIRGRNIAPSEASAIHNSMTFMEKIVRRSGVADDCGVMVEYVIPTTSNRIDFLISGKDENGNKNFVIVELKQWQQANTTDKEGIVNTHLGKPNNDTTHPSYQAGSYKLFMKDFNEAIYVGEVHPYSCAYLHNYTEKNPEPLKSEFYSEYIQDSPIYFKDDHEKLENFIKRYVGKGKGMDILYEIENGKIRPSKKLTDHVHSLFKGNKEFILLDEQKVAFEAAKNIAKKRYRKAVVIIKGGPGTGKSVISTNLLGSLLRASLNTVFVAPNASFRDVIMKSLAKKESLRRLQILFKGSSSFYECAENTFDVIIVDEAHRLKDGTAYMYKGENQIEDIINAAHTSIFFIDDDQAIRPADIGSENEILRLAEKYHATDYSIELTAQFRCSGAEGFINWITDILNIRETANYDGWGTKEFDFKIFDNPNDLREAIKEKHKNGYKARILAGYAWKWTGVKKGNADGEVDDVEIPEFDFRMPWNSRKVGSTWAIDEKGVHQVGCVHTSQGLEFDYVGVIVGKDLAYNPKTEEFHTEWKAYKDSNGKSGLKNNPKLLNLYVRRIYKILMSRGMKGCYVYFMDEEVKRYFEKRLKS